LHDYSSKQNHSIAQEFIDVETAKKSGRPQFTQMLDCVAENPTVKHILVEKTDRLLRNFFDYHLINQLINKKRDITIHLVKEGTILSADSRSSEKFVFGIKALMAKNFIDTLSEKRPKKVCSKKRCFL
jgi:site-specific DNA recombinase